MAINSEVIKAIRKNAQVFQAVIDAADALEEIGSLDNSLAESQKRLDLSRSAEAELLATSEKLKEEIKGLTGKKSEASLRADKLLADAETAAKEIVAGGKVDAQRIIADARSTADGIIADSEAKARYTSLTTDAAKAELAAINAEIAEKAKEKTALQKAIDSFKAKFA